MAKHKHTPDKTAEEKTTKAEVEAKSVNPRKLLLTREQDPDETKRHAEARKWSVMWARTQDADERKLFEAKLAKIGYKVSEVTKGMIRLQFDDDWTGPEETAKTELKKTPRLGETASE